jgi:hypothetical protein
MTCRDVVALGLICLPFLALVPLLLDTRKFIRVDLPHVPEHMLPRRFQDVDRRYRR